MTTPSAIEEAARAARNGDLAVQRRLSEWYAVALRETVVAEKALTRFIKKQRDAGLEIKPTWLNQQQRYLDLQSKYYRALREFGLGALDIMTSGIESSVVARLEGDTRLLREGLTLPGFDAQTWSAINQRAIAASVGILEAHRSPLRQLFERDFPETGLAEFRRVWTRGIAMGQNPNRIAAFAARRIATLSLGRAQLISRTEFHRAYREGKREQFTRSPSITGWTWRAALDRRTCAVCWSMHGTVHPNTEILEGHPACRCSMIPITDSPGAVSLEPGEDRFARLPADQQLRILGPSRFKLYQQGRTIGSFTTTRRSPLWGNMKVLDRLPGVPI